MPDIQKISVAVTAEQLATIKAAVASGAYASNSEVVRDALRGWELRKAEIDRVRRLWDEGLASGPMEPLDIDEILNEAQATFAAKERKRA